MADEVVNAIYKTPGKYGKLKVDPRQNSIDNITRLWEVLVRMAEREDSRRLRGESPSTSSMLWPEERRERNGRDPEESQGRSLYNWLEAIEAAAFRRREGFPLVMWRTHIRLFDGSRDEL